MEAKRSLMPLDLEPEAVSSHTTWMLEPTLGPLEGQQVLLAEDVSLQHYPHPL